MLAYCLFVCALPHAFDVARTVKQGWMPVSAAVLAAAVTLQAALGIWTLLLRVPLSLPLAHQAMAMLVLTIATTHAALVARWRAISREDIPLAPAQSALPLTRPPAPA
jgi:cytochrome c oxidase assembly protein subunit 15